ncbi:MAG: hypothetical protein ACPLRY_06805 [Candidatus Bathyarchaeales archaeon]
MNWKNVLRLISVDAKASRAVRGAKFRQFRENKIVTYALYIGACILGLLVGFLVGNFLAGITDPTLKQPILEGATNLFIALPTIALLYGLVFTQISQIQRIGAKITVQPLYWFPITWEEHTLASIIANIIGGPLIITVFVCSAILVASLLLNLLPLAVFTVMVLLISLLLASITTEVFKVVQVRIYGAITKAAGRAAVWVRLIGSIIFFIVFYAIYFSLVYNVTPQMLLEWVATGQRMLWFIPYLWPGITLSAFASGLWLETVLFLLFSVGFVYVLFLLAVNLNAKFSLYEAPTIKVSGKVYAPKTGFLGRLGFSSLEASIIRKDFKAFTRRRELMYIFVVPVVVIIMPLLSTIRGGTALPPGFSSFLFVYLTLLPGGLIAYSLGNIIVGSEGGSIWFIHSLPISAKSFVKAKYAFIVLFSLAVILVCSFAAIVIMAPSIRAIIIGALESVFLAFAIGMVSLVCGIKGADFQELPRPRMIRPLWSFINMAVCAVTGLGIIAPMIPYGFQRILQSTFMMPSLLPSYYPYVALPISGAIAFTITYIAYKLALSNAEELLRRME